MDIFSLVNLGLRIISIIFDFILSHDIMAISMVTSICFFLISKVISLVRG